MTIFQRFMFTTQNFPPLVENMFVTQDHPKQEYLSFAQWNVFLFFHDFQLTLQVLYSCDAKPNNLEQLLLVQKFCQHRQNCLIEVSRQFFGNSECPGTDDAVMHAF